MRFAEFLRTTVLMCAGGATLLAAVTVIGLATGVGSDDGAVVPVAVGWWIVAVIIGLWLGRRADTSPPIGTLLADARSGRSLPEVNPARTLLNRLWPLLVCCVGAAGVGVAFPQVPAIAAGFAIIWSLAWRRQSAAVRAIENRDGARFYVERTSPLASIKLVRTPGFRSLSPDGGHAVNGAVSGSGSGRSLS